MLRESNRAEYTADAKARRLLQEQACRLPRDVEQDSVVIASDICLFRQGLTSVLSTDGRLCIAADAGSSQDLLQLVHQYQPAIVLMDMGMPGAFAVGEEIRIHSPLIRIIALCATETEQTIARCAAVGFSGFVTREASIDELIATVRSSRAGEFACAPRVAAVLLHNLKASKPRDDQLPTAQTSTSGQLRDLPLTETPRLASSARQPALAAKADAAQQSSVDKQPGELLEHLTPREYQVAELVGKGLSNKEIARELCITLSTTKNHIHHMLEKLGARHRTEAALIIRRHASA